MNRRHTFSVLVNDHPGVLQRVSGLFARRGFNIDSITVGASETESLSRMTIAAWGDERTRTQIVHQLSKLIDVLDVRALEDGTFVARELMLLKVKASAHERPAALALAESFRCAVVDVGPETMTVQAVGDADKNNALLQLFRPFGIVELTRTGETAMPRSR